MQFKKIASILILIAFSFTNILYAAPSPISYTKNINTTLRLNLALSSEEFQRFMEEQREQHREEFARAGFSISTDSDERMFRVMIAFYIRELRAQGMNTEDILTELSRKFPGIDLEEQGVVTEDGYKSLHVYLGEGDEDYVQVATRGFNKSDATKATRGKGSAWDALQAIAIWSRQKERELTRDGMSIAEFNRLREAFGETARRDELHQLETIGVQVAEDRLIFPVQITEELLATVPAGVINKLSRARKTFDRLLTQDILRIKQPLWGTTMSDIKVIWMEPYTAYDSRGNATIQQEVVIRDENGQEFKGLATVPAGASTGEREVWINPDYVTTAREAVIPKLQRAINAGEVDITSQKSLAEWLRKLDGTVRLENIGGNVILAVCWAFADAVAKSQGIPLHQYWTNEYGQVQAVYSPEATYNILNAGAHGSATTKVDTQETQFMFLGELNAAQQNALATAVNKAMKGYLKRRGLVTTNGDEGGYSPEATSNMQYIRYLQEAVASIKDGPRWGRDIAVAFDFASSGFYKDGYYYLQGESTPIDLLEELGEAGQAYFRKLVGRKGGIRNTTVGTKVTGIQHNEAWLPDEEGIRLTRREWVAYVQYMILQVPVWSLEDVCAENDWESTRELTMLLEEDEDFYRARIEEHKDTGFYNGRRVWHLGDDSITSNPDYALLALEGSENEEFFERIDNHRVRSRRTGTEIDLRELGARREDGRYVVDPHTLNAFLLKFNQIGSPDDTFMAAEQALERGSLVSFSHRSGAAGDWHFTSGGQLRETKSGTILYLFMRALLDISLIQQDCTIILQWPI